MGYILDEIEKRTKPTIVEILEREYKKYGFNVQKMAKANKENRSTVIYNLEKYGVKPEPSDVKRRDYK